MSHLSLHSWARRRFTLVEIMVGLALLLLMMSFLFEFVISGQKLWRASEHKLNSFGDGQTVLDLVGEDLRNMVYSNEVGQSMPFYRKLASEKSHHDLTITVAGGSDVKVGADVYMFFTRYATDQDHAYHRGIYPVCYVYVPLEYKDTTGDKPNPSAWVGRLFRVLVTPDDIKEWELSNEDFAELSGKELTSLPTEFPVKFLGGQLKEDTVLVDGVSDFSLKVRGLAGIKYTKLGFLNSKPLSVQASLKVFTREAIPPEAWEEAGTDVDKKRDLMNDNERSFSKTVRID